MKKVLIASHNANKIREYEHLLGDKFDIVYRPFEEVDETGTTYLENSVLKARKTYFTVGIPVIADDSGLSMVDLGGAPGVYSARYAGVHGNWDLNTAKVIYDLKNAKPHGNWFGQYICCLTYFDGTDEITTWGFCNGDFKETPSGENGFGYDPYFFPVTAGSRSMAELDVDEKCSISHRGRATRKLLDLLERKWS